MKAIAEFDVNDSELVIDKIQFFIEGTEFVLKTMNSDRELISQVSIPSDEFSRSIRLIGYEPVQLSDTI